jgi:glycosyltransferase involved in cell wall biosynthesis
MRRVLFVEPFYSGSHRAFADGLAAHCGHEVVPLTLPGGEWRKRMRRGAIELARQFAGMPGPFDAVIATDMLDLPLFLSLTRPRLSGTPVLYYLHENQLTYPRLKGTKLNSWFGQVNYASALAADAVAFNSEFHRHDFLGALRTLAGQPTNWLEPNTIDGLEAKSAVLPVGVDLKRLDALKVDADPVPLLLWNHRWEFDKAPARFVRAVCQLAESRDGFNVAVAGDPGDNPHPAMHELRERLGHRLLHHGRLDCADDYARLLWRSKVAVSTARQEFFGIALVEAMYCETVPVAPRGLNYPALIPASAHERCLFEDEAGLVERLHRALLSVGGATAFRQAAGRWDWSRVGPAWDAAITQLIDRRGLSQQ